MSQTRDLPADVPALIRELLATDAGRPRVTWYGPNGERVEFSAKTLNNWISKTSNLLVDELDVGPGARVGIALPGHWRTVVWLLAGWSVGAHTVVLASATAPDEAGLGAADPGAAQFGSVGGGSTGTGAVGSGSAGPGSAGTGSTGPGSTTSRFDVLVTDRPTSPPPGAEESVLVVVALPALATRFMGEVPNGTVDAAAEVRRQPDVFVVTDEPAPTDPAFTATGPTVSYADLLDAARAAKYPNGVRLLTGAGPDRAIESYLAPLAAGGSVVIHHDLAALSQPDRDHLAAQEAITAVDL